MPCITKSSPNNLGQDIPLWTIEARSIPVNNAMYLKHMFSGVFPAPPFVTATGKGGLGLVDINIIKVTKQFVEISISGPNPGLRIEMHAMALDPAFPCPCPEWITGLSSPCDGGPPLGPTGPMGTVCCDVGDPNIWSGGPGGPTGWDCP